MGKLFVVIVPTFAAGIVLALAMFHIGDDYPPAQAPMTIAAACLVALVGVRVSREREEAEELRDAKWIWLPTPRCYMPAINLRMDRD